MKNTKKRNHKHDQNKKAQRPNNSGLSSKKSRLNNYEYKNLKKKIKYRGKKTCLHLPSTTSTLHYQPSVVELIFWQEQ